MTAALLVLATALAGAAGSLLRAEVVARSGPAGSTSRAGGVASVNLGGATLLALVGALAPPEPWTVVVGAGFCGALTTFSTWVVDAVVARDGGRDVRVIAAVDLVGQLAVGVGAAWLVLRVL